MKTFTGLFTALTLGAFLLTGCVNEEPPYKNTENGGTPSGTTGYLNGPALSLEVIADAETDIQGDNTEDATQTPPEGSTKTRSGIETDNYRMKIVNTADQRSYFEGSYKELSEQLAGEPMELPVGNYELQVCSHRDKEIQAAAWETPVYGANYSFSITKGATTTIEQITCTLQNIKVTLLCSADLAEQLADDATATVSLDEASMEFKKTQWDGKQAAFFMPTAAENDLEFRLNGTFVEGGDASFSRTISKVKAGQWRKIELVIAYASQGGIKLDIEVDNFLLDETITINGTDGLTEEPIDQEGGEDDKAPTIVMLTDDHDLSEPYILNQIKDIEIAIAAPNGGIKKLIVTVEAPALEQLLESVGLADLVSPGVDLCHPSPEAADVLGPSLVGFPVGDQVLNQTSVPFTVAAKFVEILAGLEPHTEGVPNTYQFNLRVTDNAGGSTEASLILVQAAIQ